MTEIGECAHENERPFILEQTFFQKNKSKFYFSEFYVYNPFIK